MPRATDNDAEAKRLARRYQAGDTTALADLYERYFEGIYTYAKVALRDHHEAEDVVHQVFVKAIEGLPRYQERSGKPFRAWLFTIARNAVIDCRRRRERARVEDPTLLESRASDRVGPEAIRAFDRISGGLCGGA